MATPRLSFTEWDYTFSPGVYGITPKNIDAAVKLMRDHFVDSPWARPADIELPEKDSFDEQGNLVKPLSFAGFDTWVKRWEGARYYLLFLNSPTSIAGCEMGTKEFDVRVRNWAAALGNHITSLGLKHEQVGVMIKDEPNETALKTILAWAKPIKDAMPGIIIFQDCNNPTAFRLVNEIQAHQLANISCPEIGPFYRGGDDQARMFAKLVSDNHKNWFYQCYGPARLLDPYQYNRLEAWHCFKYGATGMGLWAFADTGAFKDSWNEYTCGGPSYSPVFFKGDELYSGIHYEAVREGIEDYEYLSMLKDAVQKSESTAFKSQAEKLLQESVDSVLSGKYNSDEKLWTWKNDRSRAEAYRIKILRLLEKASK